MNQKTYDAIVVGAGGMGSAAAWHLARRGASVLVLEQFAENHEMGSSQGDTRLIRKAYFEHPDYVPLLHRAYDLWDELAAESGRSLFHRTGLILAGDPKSSKILSGVKQARDIHGLDIQEWNAQTATEMYPQFNFPDDWTVLFEEDAGYLRVEECVQAHLACAKNNSAEIMYNTNVTSWQESNEAPTGIDTQSRIAPRVTVQTNRGTFHSSRLIITSGPWAARQLAATGIKLSLRRVMQHWFKAPPEADERQGMPCFGFDTGNGFFYGMPARDGAGLKSASHSHGIGFDDPDFMDRSEADNDLPALKNFLARFIKGMPDATAIKTKPCIYTLTADEHFIIDAWPSNDSGPSHRVYFAAGFSGHGFKFASVVGELLADLALVGSPRIPCDFLKIRPAVMSKNLDNR